ncbi:MAG: hypothetical protein KDA66_19490, partial [Planctomycetaceae bacterium]|nr:hypothetical protein [Planctomycetaceae bacterium]
LHPPYAECGITEKCVDEHVWGSSHFVSGFAVSSSENRSLDGTRSLTTALSSVNSVTEFHSVASEARNEPAEQNEYPAVH